MRSTGLARAQANSDRGGSTQTVSITARFITTAFAVVQNTALPRSVLYWSTHAVFERGSTNTSKLEIGEQRKVIRGFSGDSRFSDFAATD